MPYPGAEGEEGWAEVPWLGALTRVGKEGIGAEAGAVIAAGCYSHAHTMVRDEILSG